MQHLLSLTFMIKQIAQIVSDSTNAVAFIVWFVRVDAMLALTRGSKH